MMNSFMVVKVRFKPLEWFECNAFIDIDGEYWETPELRDSYNIGEDYELPFDSVDTAKCVQLVTINGRVWDVLVDHLEIKMWGIKSVYTREDNPEYFI